MGSIPTHSECSHYARRTSGSKASTKQQKYSVGPTRRWPHQRLTSAEIRLITQISRVNNAGDLSSESKALNTPVDPTWPHERDTANPLEKRVCAFYHINPVLVSVSVFLLNVTTLICVSENLKLYYTRQAQAVYTTHFSGSATPSLRCFCGDLCSAADGSYPLFSILKLKATWFMVFFQKLWLDCPNK